MSYTNAITKEVIPLNQISGGFTVPYHKQGIVTASGLMRKNQHTIATLSLSQLWATLPMDLKELLDSNELVNYDDIMSFYKNHPTHHTLSSQSYAPENSILLANYYEHHTNTEDPTRNLIIVTNLIYNVIFLTFANLTHDENNNQVTFTTAIDHFYNRGKIHSEQQTKYKDVLKLIDDMLGTTLEESENEKLMEAKSLLNELVFANDFPRLLDMYRLVGKAQKKLLTARTISLNMEEEESTTIDYQDDSNDSKSELMNESTITINMPTLSLASSILTTPTVVEPPPKTTVQFTKKITQGNVGSIHWTGEWYGSTLLLATDLTKQQPQKSSLTMKVMTHATSTALIFIFLLFYIKKSRQLLIMHELKQQKRGNRKKNKENWKVCFTS